MDQRWELVRLASPPGVNKSQLARRFAIDRSTLNKWTKRYREEGQAGLADRSRRPHENPNRTGASIEAEVLRIRAASNNVWGGRKIAAAMRRGGWAAVPAASTITEILRRHGKLVEGPAGPRGPYCRFERSAPNELWQMDFKGHFPILAGRCHPLGVLDDHSRYALGLEACADEQDLTVRGRLTVMFRRHGLPEVMLMDNGPPWGDTGCEAYTGLGVWLLRLGIRVAHGRPRHPQTQGKEERFHRTLNLELLQGRSFRDIPDCQRAFDDWRPFYNQERPHQALGFATPSERYRPSERSYPEVLPAIEYGAADQVRKVNGDGFISFKSRVWRAGKAFRGLSLALRPTRDDGIWSLHFASHRVGTINLRTGDAKACGYVDNADALPTSPQAPPPQQP